MGKVIFFFIFLSLRVYSQTSSDEISRKGVGYIFGDQVKVRSDAGQKFPPKFGLSIGDKIQILRKILKWLKPIKFNKFNINQIKIILL